jgi:hypothetical protein
MIGTGGLGSPIGLYLAAAGVGHLGIVDFDVVNESNLQRQIMHGSKDVGRPKIASAYDRLHDVNPHVNIKTYQTALSSEKSTTLARFLPVGTPSDAFLSSRVPFAASLGPHALAAHLVPNVHLCLNSTSLPGIFYPGRTPGLKMPTGLQ